MKKEINRERKLPAFSLSIGDLEALWSRLTALFDDPADIYALVTIWLPLEQLEFKNLEELRQYPHLPSRVTNFHFWLSQKECRISIRSQLRWGSRARVYAVAGTEAWCAGAVETVFSFVQSYKLWYNWFLSAPVYWALILMGAAPGLAMLSTGDHLERVHPFLSEHQIAVTAGCPVAAFTLLLLWFANERLLPSAVIRISDSKGFVRHHATELSLAIGVVSVIVAVIGWFVKM